MNMTFELINKELLLSYSPENGTDYIIQKIEQNETIRIKNTFLLSKEYLRSETDEETIQFLIGKEEGSYIKIESEVFETSHNFFFDKNIKFKPSIFVAHRNISILKKLDELINKDFYIGGEWEKKKGISLEMFNKLLDLFPKTAELNKYADNRIASILKEFFPECDRYEKIFDSFINKKDLTLKKICNTKPSNANLQIEYAQFKSVLSQLNEMLSSSVTIAEPKWQNQIKDIVCLLYPKYIYSSREIEFSGIDAYKKKPDFILVDSNGYIDILEIKKPDVQLLTEQASYRHNYIPVRELAGAVQQIEKYIFCLNSLDTSKQRVIEKLKSDPVLKDIDVEIVNPQGMLILGRSNDFNSQQKRDFELIKRQYKNIADIMTYDDLLHRLQNIISSLEKRIMLN